jgi:vitamin B12 transporter
MFSLFCRRPGRPSARVVAVSAASILPLLSLSARADEVETLDPIVVGATRVATPASQLASSVTVITAQEIERNQWRTLPDVLRAVPGLTLVQTGGPGGTASVYMRGTNANHTKVLIDGIAVSDPSSANGSFDFSQVLTGDIARVEVLRGPQSGLYGSDAIGGVINIITKAGEGKPTGSVGLEGGSFGTFNQNASLRGSSGRVTYALSLLHDRSIEVPVTPTNLIPAGEKRVDDLSDNQTLSTKLGAALSETTDVGLVARITRTKLESTGDHYDGASGAYVPDGSHSYTDANSYFTRATLHQSLFDGVFDHTFGVAYTDYRRRYAATDGVPNYYRGDRVKGDWQGNVHVAEGEIVTLGAETQRDSIDDAQQVYGASDIARAHVTNSAGFLQLQSDLHQRVENAVSLRYDDNGRFGSKTTYRIAPALLLPETGTKLKASVGTGFKAPSLDQLYDNYPAYGFYANPNLQPEKSIGMDVGFEQKINGVTFGSTWFQNWIDNLIDYNATYTSYANVAKAETKGLENFVAFDPLPDVTVRADYTYTLAENAELHQELSRRPKHKASVTASWRATDALTLSATAILTGDWIDTDREGTVARLKASGYTTADLAANYALTDRLSVFGRITNLLDRRVENPIGFQQPGIGAYAGVKVGGLRKNRRAPTRVRRKGRRGLQQHAARHLDPLSVHPTVLIGQQGGDHRADIVGQPGAAQGGDRGDEAVAFGLVAHRAAAEIGFDGPGRHGVDGDAARPQLLGQIAGQHLDRALHGGVGGKARQAEAGQAGRQVDDPPAIGDQRQQGLGQEEHAFEMDVHQAVEFRFGGLGEGGVDADAGIVDEVVEALAPPGFGQDGFHRLGEGAERGDVAGIEAQRHRLAAQRGDLRHRAFGLGPIGMIGQQNVAAAPGDGQGGVAAQAPAGAGDQGDLVGLGGMHAIAHGGMLRMMGGVDPHPRRAPEMGEWPGVRIPCPILPGACPGVPSLSRN